MGLETGTYIDSLNSAWPLGATDPKSEGDDHLRLIKSTVLNTLPNITGAVTADHTELNLLDGATASTAELNILTGVTASAAELNYNNITTLGTAQASKTMTLDASKGITGITSLTSVTINASTTLQIGGVSLTASAAELNYVNGVTSAIQGQIDGKQASDAGLTDIAALAVTDSNFIVGNGSNWVAETGATARASLGVDAAGVDNSTNVTLAGTPDYITLVGQVITRGLIVLTTDISGTLPLGNGGTNATTAAGARTSLGLGALAVLASVSASEIDANAVGQSEVANASIGRGELITATVSLAGSVASSALVGISLTAYSFFPMIHSTNDVSLTMRMQGHRTDAASADSPQFEFYNQTGYTQTYDVDYRYIGA